MMVCPIPRFPGLARWHPWTRRPTAVVILVLSLLAGQARAECADLALVLAIDASGSIAADEYALQQQGYAHAFRNPRVQAALSAAGTVDIGVVVWGDTEMAPQVIPFMRLRSAADAVGLSRQIAALPRRVHGNTGIGTGVSAALDLLDASEGCAIRRMVNVSGDGRETLMSRPRNHVPMVAARERAAGMRVTINALAIETDEAGLADWYRDRVITGPGAFVMRVDGFESFGASIIEKLVREIAPPAMTAAPIQAHGSPDPILPAGRDDREG